MKSLAELLQAARGVVRFRRRTVLMMTGIAVGITALTTLDSIGEDTRRETMKRVKNMLGTFDTVVIRPGGRSRGMVSLATVEPALKFSDAEAIASGLPEIKQVAQLQNAFDVEVSYRDRESNPAVFGVSSNWLDLRGDEVAEGDFLTQQEIQSMARVAVLGPSAYQALFPDHAWKGKTIRIGNVPFEVKGVLASRGAGPAGADLDNLILIPVTTASKRLFNRDFLTMIIAQLKNPHDGEKASRSITALLRLRHHLAPTALDDFNITSPRAVAATMTNVSSALARTLKGIAFLVMLIGGVVIMSLMMMGVSERTSEIGVRRSVGANRIDILFQFLVEALIVSVFGGSIGLALGVFCAQGLAAYQRLPFTIEKSILLTHFLLAALVGLVFGLYPAWRASRVNPIVALRS